MGDNEQQSLSAKEAVKRFVARFAPVYQDLLYHAALPLVLTPELLNYLRSEFLADRVDWVAEADLLLSDLCQEIGYEQYAMRLDVRAHLLAGMQKTLGEQRMQEVARRLLAWVHHLAHTNPRQRPHELQTQQWAAMVYLQEKRAQAVQEIAQALQQCETVHSSEAGQANWNLSEMARLSHLITDLAHQLQDYPELVQYAQLTTKLLGNTNGQAAGALPSRAVSIKLADDEIRLSLPLSIPPESPATILVGEILRGTVESIDYLSTLSGTPNLACPLRVNIDLGAAGKGIAPASDFMASGQINLKPGDEADIIVTHPPNKEGVFGVANPHALHARTWFDLEDAFVYHYCVIGRVIELPGTGELGIQFGDVFALPKDAELEQFRRFPDREIALFITEFDTERSDWSVSFSQEDQIPDERHFIVELDKERHNLAVSFSWANQIRYEKHWESAAEIVKENAIIEGRIVDSEIYGLDVDLAGVPGVIPADELDQQTFEDGEYVLVKVLSFEDEARHFILSLKQLQVDAWDSFFNQHQVGDLVLGKVASYLPDGVNVALDGGVEAFCSNLHLAYPSPAQAEEVLKIGAELMFRLLRLNQAKKEISLTLTGATSSDQLELLVRKAIQQQQEKLGEQLREAEAAASDLYLARVSGQALVELESVMRLAPLFLAVGDLPTARELFFHAQLLAGDLGSTLFEYDATLGLGELEKALGNADDALRFFDQAVELAKQQILTWGESQAWSKKAEIYNQLNDWANALQCYEEALRCAFKSDDAEALQTIFAQVAEVFPSTDGPQVLAEDFYRRQVVTARAVGTKFGELLANYQFAKALAAGKEYKLAIQHAQHTLSLATAFPQWPNAEALRAQIADWQTQLTRQQQPTITLTPFEFETVMLNKRGEEIERKRLQVQEFIEDLGNDVTLEMIEIPGGIFTMGAPKEEEQSRDDERPQHKVTISPFFMGKFTITQAQWRAIAEDHSLKIEHDLKPEPSFFKGKNRRRHFIDDDRRPVEQVGWEDAMEYCARLSKKTGRTYRLPTGAEWEYACRAGTTTPFAFGETITIEIVNYDGDYPYAKAPKGEYRGETIPVGSLGVANTFGLFDMHGNVWEWCQDWYGEYSEGRQTDPVGPETGEYRVLRGGSWNDLGYYCRSAFRYDLAPGDRYNYYGFRVVVAARTM